MAYSGYLLKFGSTELSYEYIRAASYHTTPSQRLDLDSYRDANGVLHRTALEHTASKIEWETPPLDNTQLQTLLSIFRSAMTNVAERKVTVTYYNEESNSYVTGTFYMPDAEYTIRHVTSTILMYEPIRFALIEY